MTKGSLLKKNSIVTHDSNVESETPELQSTVKMAECLCTILKIFAETQTNQIHHTATHDQALLSHSPMS